MKKTFFRTGALLGFSLALLTGCGNPAGGGEEGREDLSRYREMRQVIPPGETVQVTGGGGSGAFPESRNLTLGAFCIARYETTWELWREVYDWAQAHEYRIANPGTEGHGTSGTGDQSKGWPKSRRTLRPVTGVSWRDAVVWCNAYSEMTGREPVYYTEDGGAVLRESVNNTENYARIDTAADRAKMMTAKNGFRLPTEAEWEFAARGGDSEAPDWAFAYAGSGIIGEVAWYGENASVPGSPDYGAHPAGTKTGGMYRGANRLDLYDMSGNVYEWCWDWYGDDDEIRPETGPEGSGPGVFAHRVIRGGNWTSYAGACKTANRNYFRPFSRSPVIGFRLAASL
ncbi:MAG: formylglycine-generating enzyme family protein [Treponema sp.]|jgi:formylglycine-generating enzyme required for sulfatase activity|nr:formylglycine-generating enzyme family protein [Treponema sp.]